jgi:hypothetical protein
MRTPRGATQDHRALVPRTRSDLKWETRLDFCTALSEDALRVAGRVMA